MGIGRIIRRLPASVLRKAWKVNHALAETATVPEIAEVIFDSVRSIAPYDAATLYGQDPLTRAPLPDTFFLKFFPDNELIQKYNSYYFFKNPILFTMSDPHCHNHGLTQTDFIKQSAFLETEFYVDFFKPMGLCHTLFLHAVFQGKMVCTATFHRKPGAKGYSDSEKGALTLIAPMMASAFFSVALREGLYNPPAPDALPRVDGLTPREEDIVALIMRGMSNKEIAEIYRISDKTVMTHITSILRKTGRKNRIDLITSRLTSWRGPERT